MIKIKPHLVDHTLIPKPRVIPHVPKRLPEPKVEISRSTYFNILGILVLAIGGIYLYYRYEDREQVRERKHHSIIRLTQDIKETKEALNHASQ